MSQALGCFVEGEEATIVRILSSHYFKFFYIRNKFLALPSMEKELNFIKELGQYENLMPIIIRTGIKARSSDLGTKNSNFGSHFREIR